VKRASQVWLGSQFQIGFAQMMPSAMVLVVKTRPTSAADLASRSARRLPRHSTTALAPATSPKQRKAAIAEDTWT
jgi:hypothetical protein